MRYYLLEKEEKVIKSSEQEFKVVEVFSGKKDLKDVIVELICKEQINGRYAILMAISNSHKNED